MIGAFLGVVMGWIWVLLLGLIGWIIHKYPDKIGVILVILIVSALFAVIGYGVYQPV